MKGVQDTTNKTQYEEKNINNKTICLLNKTKGRKNKAPERNIF